MKEKKRFLKAIDSLPSLNDEAFMREGDFANNWFDTQEDWDNEGKTYTIHNYNGKMFSCSECKEQIKEGIVVIINSKRKKRLEVPYSVIHFADEHPRSYEREPIYKGRFPKKHLKDILK